MKKILIYGFTIVAINYIHSQDIDDVIRFSNVETQGTARFKAMGGAFGALGGDISAVSINPAGSSVFNTSHGTFSASTERNNMDITYGNSLNNNSFSTLGLNQIGAAFVFKNYKKNSALNKFVLTILYQNRH